MTFFYLSTYVMQCSASTIEVQNNNTRATKDGEKKRGIFPPEYVFKFTDKRRKTFCTAQDVEGFA